MYKPNNLVLRSTASLIIFILFGFAIYLLMAGHNSPGGGFVGGLATTAAILLMYMAYGEKAVKKILPINYIVLIPIGLLFALGTGFGALIFSNDFLTHEMLSLHMPFFGEVELGSAMLFDIGVYLTVVGTTMTIILNIAMDR